MTFTLKEKELLKKALDLYVEETAEQYKFTQNLNIDFSPDFEKSMQRLIKRQKKPYFKLINTVAKRVAIIIAVIIIALTSTVLSVDALREKIKNFVIETFEKFSIVVYNDNLNTIEQIKEYYSPSYIPKGYEISRVEKGEIDNYILYKNKNGSEIHYTQICLSYQQSYIDTHNCIIEEIDKYLFIRKESINRNAIYFSDKNYSYEIVSFGDLDKEELLKIAQSLKAEK